MIFGHFVGGGGLGLGDTSIYTVENLEWRNLNKKVLL